MYVTYAFLYTADESLNELCPAEVLAGVSMFPAELEPCQQRILSLSPRERYLKVLTLAKLNALDEADRA